MAAAACNQVCLFAIITVIARELGGKAVGEYSLGWALLVITNLLALWGFQNVLIRFVAVYLAENDDGRVRGVIRLALRVSTSSSFALAALIAIFAGPISDLFGQPHLTTTVRLVALALPASTVRDAALAATQGWRSQRAYALIASVYEPVLRLSLTCVALIGGWDVTAVFAAIPISAWTAAVLAVVALRVRMRSLAPAAPVIDAGPIWRYSSVSWGSVMATVGLIWADTLILGALGTASEVGVYNVSTRVVNLAVFVWVPLVSALDPQFARLLHRGERAGLGRLYTISTRWILSLSMPAFIVLLVYPKDLLGLFGADYGAGVAATVILCIGQLINGATGACGALQNMSGHIRLNLINNAVALALNIGLNLALIPAYGLTGAAVAWSISLGAVNLVRVIENKIVFGLLPFDRSVGKVVVAALVATGAAIAVRWLIDGHVVALLVGAAGATVVYVGALLLLGIEPDDRSAVRSVLGRPAIHLGDADQVSA